MAEKTGQPKLEFKVSAAGKEFKVGAKVKFMLHRREYSGTVLKQLSNSAIIEFDDKFAEKPLVAELKQKVVISYHNLELA